MFKNLSASIIIVLAPFLLLNCVTMEQLAPEEQAYVDEAMACPLSITVSAADIDQAWGRAQSFVGRLGSMKLQIATDYVIQTYNPTTSTGTYGYYVTKTPMGSNFEISVQCVIRDPFLARKSERNAHILAYYIKTGELIEHLVKVGVYD